MKEYWLKMGSALLVMVGGCATFRDSIPPDVDHVRDIDSQPISFRPTGVLAQLIDNQPTPPTPGQSSGKPARNVLVLSGGGKCGAYSAGVLCGWSAAGTRPRFDVVTGVSTGALIAPLAFLGSAYDQVLAESYTNVRTGDIYTRRPLLAVPLSPSLADSAPLRRRIERLVDEGLLVQIAQAHAEGRRLYVATTNLHTGREVDWDLGAIAAGTHPEKAALFRKILLASCSIPGLFPPVPIEIEVNGRRYTELHADGGIRTEMFLHPGILAGDNQGAGTSVHVIVAGKLSPPHRGVESRLTTVSFEALRDLLEAKTLDDVQRVFLLTRLTGGRFALTSVPPDFPANLNAARFEPEEMRQLFRSGYTLAASGVAWQSLPPGIHPKDWTWPRAGVRFITNSSTE